jgi:hypothetical protein
VVVDQEGRQLNGAMLYNFNGQRSNLCNQFQTKVHP